MISKERLGPADPGEVYILHIIADRDIASVRLVSLKSAAEEKISPAEAGQVDVRIKEEPKAFFDRPI